MNNFAQAAPLLIRGAATTLGLWAASAGISICIGGIWGTARCDHLRTRCVAGILDITTFVLRGVPFYVQLLIAYFVLPQALGLNLPACAAAACSLGLCSAAYTSQIVRAAINAVATGQWEAAYVLGYSKAQTVRFIVFPQALRICIPPLLGELDQVLKSTAVISSIGVLELTRAAMNIVARTMDPLPMYLCIAAVYLSFSWILTMAAAAIERKLFS